MNNSNIHLSKFNLVYLVILSLLVASCGSYQSTSYDDGIYGSEPVNDTNKQTDYDQSASRVSNSAGYYESLFAEGAESYGNNFGQDSIFTDVESYSGTSYVDADPDYTGSYGGGAAAWGENPSQININYYNNGFGWNNWGWGPGWGWNAGFGWGGFGWNNWGWNRGFGWGHGWNNWGWGPGWAGYGWNAGFGWNYGWG